MSLESWNKDNFDDFHPQKETIFSDVPADRTAVDNILRVNHGNQMRLGLMADAKANIMITVSSIVFSVTVANLDIEVMKWPLLGFAFGCFLALLFAIFAIIPNTDYPKVKGTKEIDRNSPIFNPLFFGHFAHLDIHEYKEDYAKIFNADSCEIYTDVDGVYSSDPNKIPVAKKIDKISYEEMLELSSLGAKVMQSSAVQTAMIHDIPLEVKSTFTNRKGTKIFGQENIDYNKVITGVAYSKDEAKITLIGVQDKPGVAAEVFEPISKSQINIDMVIQNVSSDGKTTVASVTFTNNYREAARFFTALTNFVDSK